METEELNVDDLFEELEAIMTNRWPPDEYGEDSDLSSIYSIAEEFKNEIKSLREQLKQERNKAINECYHLIARHQYDTKVDKLLQLIESLKDKPEPQ